MVHFKRAKISSIQRRLADVGIEVTPTEIWKQALSDAGENQEIAMAILDSWDTDQLCFEGLVQYLSGELLPPVVIYEPVFVEVSPDPVSLVVAGSIGFLLGVLFSLLFLGV